MTRIWITPHSMDADALHATEYTLRSLRGGGSFARDQNGAHIVNDGWVAVDVEAPSFVIWAAERQGYVVAAREGEL